MSNIDKTETVNLLWTGGWDSTFRLLDLLYSTEAYIQTHYMIATGRPSTIKEIETMGRIRHMIGSFFDNSTMRLAPTKYYSIHEIPKYQEVQRKLNRIGKKIRLPTQYYSLVNMAKWQDLDKLEVCLVATHEWDGGIANYIKNNLEKVPGPGGISSYALSSISDDEDESVLKYFTYPTIMQTKLDLKEIAIKKGFLPILLETWFCHAPIDGKPCGLCMPCEIAILSSLSERIGRRARLRHKLSPIFMLFPRHRRRRF